MSDSKEYEDDIEMIIVSDDEDSVPQPQTAEHGSESDFDFTEEGDDEIYRRTNMQPQNVTKPRRENLSAHYNRLRDMLSADHRESFGNTVKSRMDLVYSITKVVKNLKEGEVEKEIKVEQLMQKNCLLKAKLAKLKNEL